MRAEIEGEWINLHFRYDPMMVAKVKAVADREWRPKQRHWRVPATAWHAQRLIEQFGLLMPAEIRVLAGKNGKPKEVPRVRDKRLRKYQKKAVTFAWGASGRVLIGDDCGLGKTPESLIYVKEDPDVEKVIIIAPANVVFKWQREVTTWLDLPSQVLESKRTPIDPDIDIQIASYEIARERVEELIAQGYDLMILDECHYIKSYKAQRTRAVKMIAADIPKVLLLSGTPFLSRPIEMFTSLHLIDPKGYPNWWKFGVRYGGGQYCQGFTGATNIEELRERLKSVMIRRLKSDPEIKAELPKLTRTKLPVTISNLKTYQAVRAGDPTTIRLFRMGRPSEGKDYFENGLEKLSMLREVVGQGKVDAAVDWADSFLGQTEANRKLVIYVHHETVVRELALRLRSYGAGAIIGGTSKRDRDTLARNFQSGPLPRVLLISSAGGIGIDLFGTGGNHCSDMLVVEREWTSAEEEQAESRLHRTGQHDPVNVWILVAQGTVDKDIDELIDTKRALMGSILGTNAFRTVTAEVLKRLEDDDGEETSHRHVVRGKGQRRKAHATHR